MNCYQNLRSLFPQFAEQSPSGLYAQQGICRPILEYSFDYGANKPHLDAEECWSQVVNAIKGPVPGLDGSSGSAARTFVEQYMLGEMRTV